MGLLDDAIRDHLDLKRRRGGDPAEIERAEREALGPVRRDPIASEDGPDGLESSAGPEAGVLDLDAPASDHEPAAHDHQLDEEPAEGEEWDDYEDDDYEDDEEPEPEHPGAGSHASDTASHPSESEHDYDGLRPGSAPVHEDPDATRAYEIEPPPSRPDEDGEDVLEETPDFLQDTPDHDRLWFEQRPPKDFDFDE